MIATGITYDSCRHSRHSLAAGHIGKNNRTGRYTTILADANITKHFRTSANENTVSNLRMPVFLFLASPAKRHGVQHRNIVTDNRRFTDHDRMGMINHHTTPDPSSRMDINAEHFRGAHLNEISHVPSPLPPKPMGNPIGLQRLKPFEEKDGLQEAMACRITIIDRNKIGTRSGPNVRLRTVSLIRNLAQQLLAHLTRSKFQGKTIGKRSLQRRVVQQTGMDQRTQQGFIANRTAGLIANARPDRINRGYFRFDMGHLRLPLLLAD